MRKYIKALLFAVSITLTTAAYSQPLPNGDPGSNGDTPVGGQAPIDGGLPILLLAGVVYVIINKYQKNRIKRREIKEHIRC